MTGPTSRHVSRTINAIWEKEEPVTIVFFLTCTQLFNAQYFKTKRKELQESGLSPHMLSLNLNHSTNQDSSPAFNGNVWNDH